MLALVSSQSIDPAPVSNLGSVYSNAIDLMLAFYNQHRKHPDRLMLPNNGSASQLKHSIWYQIRQRAIQGGTRSEPYFCGMRIELLSHKTEEMAVSLSTTNLYLTLTQLRHPSAP